MIIFLDNFGRLGNQLFQYTVLKKEYPRERILLVGFDDLYEACELSGVSVFTKSIFRRKIFFNFFKNLLIGLQKIRLISSLEESFFGAEYELLLKRGLVSNIVIVRNSFFQHKKYTSYLPVNVDIKLEYIDQAKLLLNQVSADSPSREHVFIHVRRGDYVVWPNWDHPAVLPASWYFDVMKYFKNKLSNPIFLILTDDQAYVRDVFLGASDVQLIATGNQYIDFAFMSLCKYGVLSASTFSWWAANFSRKRLSVFSEFEFVAPNYWVGHSCCEWSPPHFQTEWLTYLPVIK